MVTQRDYSKELVRAARSVLLELMHLLGEYWENIAKHFASEKHIGPRFVADFEEITDAGEREIRERDVYEKVNYLLQKLGVL